MTVQQVEKLYIPPLQHRVDEQVVWLCSSHSAYRARRLPRKFVGVDEGFGCLLACFGVFLRSSLAVRFRPSAVPNLE